MRKGVKMLKKRLKIEENKKKFSNTKIYTNSFVYLSTYHTNVTKLKKFVQWYLNTCKSTSCKNKIYKAKKSTKNIIH